MAEDEHDQAEPEAPGQREPQPAPSLTPPRDLLTAYLLLLLRNWSMHGYQLMQQLVLFGYQPSDPGSIYRQLRQLERQGFIRSSWETSDAGPARRTYTLTDAGDTFLNAWATAIENYQKTLQFWSDLYSGMINPGKRD
ncbi:MAG TPA: helix-turn-helix transcriptional regulator [Dehalococcoidia bacterium]